jgi:DNA-binding NarL/FixJ family response regulator
MELEILVMKARILVVDDHPLLREGVVQLISRQADMESCGEAATAAAAIIAIREQQPDLVLLDLRLGQDDGLELIKRLRVEAPKLRILVLSQFDEKVYALRALRAGAHGYVMKQEASQRTVSAIREVLSGQLAVSLAIHTLALRQVIDDKPGAHSSTAADRLSDRELQVLNSLGSGLSTREIASRLNLSVKTVETYRENLKAKLDLADAKALINFACQWSAGKTG